MKFVASLLECSPIHLMVLCNEIHFWVHMLVPKLYCEHKLI